MAFTFVDRGGTFTDVVTWTPGAPPVARKVRSDEAVVGELAEGRLVFGTTVATNALLERRVVPTLLVVTRGFGDLPRLRAMARPSLFDPDAAWPAPLATRVVEVDGRIGPDGVEVEPLVVPELPLDGVEAVAIVLLHGPRNPAHERAVADAVRARRPDLHVALGHEVSAEVGYLARVETTLVDAAVTPVLRTALRRDRIPDDALAVRSDGSLVRAAELRAPDAVLSGPAGGVLAVAAIARRFGGEGAVGLDMGGTSTDVCLVHGDALPRRPADVLVAGVAVRREMLEVETIAAGGGSVLHTDGLRLRVGPRSAGADPGPQCYGRGGPPTVTDAALALGLLDPAAFSPALDASRVALPGDAAEYVDVAREAMAAAVRRIAAARGVDVAALPLVAYGGAAGQHAAAVAERLGQRTVLVHPFSAVLSAWGQTLARPEQVAVRPVWRRLGDAWPDVPGLVAALLAEVGDGEHEVRLELRPVGTDHALAVPHDAALDVVVDRFREAHRRVFGFDREQATLELVNVRARRLEPGLDVPEPGGDPFGVGPGARPGPCRLDAATTSIVVPEGWVARLDRGLVRLDHERALPRPEPTARTPYGTSLWASRFMAVAEQAGERLARLARSVNIRERRDFSCAVFDGEGRLVANAPHVPVHLGAMGETVRDLLAHVPDAPHGSAWLTNDPRAGGSHLPDLTVVTPVIAGGWRFFVACRGHHVDVGGLTPGSMPPHSTRLSDEGLVFRRLPLLDGDRLRPLDDALAGCRDPATVRADLEAQVAANRAAVEGLLALGAPDVVAAWTTHLQDAADEGVAALLASVVDGHAEDELDGIPLRVAVSARDGRLTVDFRGTGGPHPGNLNAPRAVVRAAVLYVLRVLVADDVPLNEGALRRVDLVVPPGSLLDPPADAAVVGGNVETSQRLVDLLLRALGARAAGQGTMNNLTLGGEGWSLYETIGGGQGASAHGDGVSGLQVHMTNTRATDAEVLETRLPLRVRAFALRPGSGGDGLHCGGDGVVREIEVLAPARASLLATRRDRGAPGLHGGGAGSPGHDEVCRDGVWDPWDGRPVALRPGDRVRVATPGGGGYGDVG